MIYKRIGRDSDEKNYFLFVFTLNKLKKYLGFLGVRFPTIGLQTHLKAFIIKSVLLKLGNIKQREEHSSDKVAI